LKLHMILTLMMMMTCPMLHLVGIKIYFVSKCLSNIVPQIFEIIHSSIVWNFC
jgi:hypothetical protein